MNGSKTVSHAENWCSRILSEQRWLFMEKYQKLWIYFNRVMKNLAFQIFNNQKLVQNQHVKNPTCFWQFSPRVPMWPHHSFGSEYVSAFCTAIMPYNTNQHSLETTVCRGVCAFTVLQKQVFYFYRRTMV